MTGEINEKPEGGGTAEGKGDGSKETGKKDRVKIWVGIGTGFVTFIIGGFGAFNAWQNNKIYEKIENTKVELASEQYEALSLHQSKQRELQQGEFLLKIMPHLLCNNAEEKKVAIMILEKTVGKNVQPILEIVSKYDADEGVRKLAETTRKEIGFREKNEEAKILASIGHYGDASRGFSEALKYIDVEKGDKQLLDKALLFHEKGEYQVAIEMFQRFFSKIDEKEF